MHSRTISIFTLSKTYALTGVRLGYVVVADPTLRDRMRKVLFYTVSNTSSLIQYGALGALEGSQTVVADFRAELAARRDLFYDGLADAGCGVLTANRPAGAFYAFVHVHPDWRSPLPPDADSQASRSWAMAEFLIRKGRIGCVPGVDFGSRGEGYLRFCFARERSELTGALESMKEVLQSTRVHAA
jgi:aspartate/methionine/tyrosine aminotransferase